MTIEVHELKPTKVVNSVADTNMLEPDVAAVQSTNERPEKDSVDEDR